MAQYKRFAAVGTEQMQVRELGESVSISDYIKIYKQKDSQT